MLYFVNNKIMMSNLTSTFLLFTLGKFFFCWHNKGRPFENLVLVWGRGKLGQVKSYMCHQPKHHCLLVAVRGSFRHGAWEETAEAREAQA